MKSSVALPKADISPANLHFVRELVHRESGIVLGPDKAYLIQTRLRQVAGQEGAFSIDELCNRLRFKRDLGLEFRIVEALTINETSFFRDTQPFETLKRIIFPELLRRRAPERRISIWSAACSTGQEAYSIGMTIMESLFGISGWSVNLLATDISRRALNQARDGRYSQLEVSRGISKESLRRYFTKDDRHWVVRPSLKELVEFREANLTQNLAARVRGPFDVIFCRNVLIYFDSTTKTRILGSLRQLLKPDGYLFLGAAEDASMYDPAFQRTELGRASAYRIKSAA